MPIAVGLPNDVEAFSRWLVEVGCDPKESKVISAATLNVSGVNAWIGVPPPANDMTYVRLHAPDPKTGDDPDTWLEFRPGEWKTDQPFCCWTTDLIAVATT